MTVSSGAAAAAVAVAGCTEKTLSLMLSSGGSGSPAGAKVGSVRL